MFGFPGGVVYPIILQSLFAKVGFCWGIRISGLVSSVICAIATLMVSSLFIQKKAGLYFDFSTIADIRFAFLATGSVFVVLGESKTKPFRYLIVILPWPVRFIHPILLHCGIRQVPFHLRPHGLLHPCRNERRRSPRSNSTRLPIRQSWPLQPPRPIRVPLRTLMSRLLVLHKIARLCDAVFCCLRIPFGLFRIGY